MKVNFDAVLHNLSGKPMTYVDQPATLKVVAIESLMGMTESDRQQTGEEKLKRYVLATKVNVGGEIDLPPEEVAEIKRRIGMCYGPDVIGPAYRILNG